MKICGFQQFFNELMRKNCLKAFKKFWNKQENSTAQEMYFSIKDLVG